MPLLVRSLASELKVWNRMNDQARDALTEASHTVQALAEFLLRVASRCENGDKEELVRMAYSLRNISSVREVEFPTGRLH